MKKRILCLILVVLSLLSVFSLEVLAQEPMSEEFKSVLNEDGKLEIPSVLPTNAKEAEVIVEYLLNDQGYRALFDGWETDYSKCVLECVATGEKHTVEVVFAYDDTDAEKVIEIAEQIPENISIFETRDFEIVNYWMHTVGDHTVDDRGNGLNNYSGDLKKILESKNVDIYVSFQKGGGNAFCSTRRGVALFSYNGMIHHIDYHIGSNANHILYVPDNTGDTPDELLAAVQKRFDEYAGKDVLKAVYGGDRLEDAEIALTNLSIEKYTTLMNQAIAENDTDLANDYQNRIDNAKWYAEYMENERYDYNYYSFLNEAEGGHWFSIEINGNTYYFIVVKDSSNMIYPEYVSTDVNTDVSVSTDDSSVPLDTLIAVDKVDKGDKYQKIVDRLKVKENVTYDIELHSNTKGAKITKLENGQFEVRIPITPELKNKELSAYFIDENDKIIEYPVKVEDGFGIFYTNHFSTYTLAETVDNNESTTGSKEEAKKEETQKEETKVQNPPTDDMNIGLFVFVGIIGAAVIAAATSLATFVISKRR